MTGEAAWMSGEAARMTGGAARASPEDEAIYLMVTCSAFPVEMMMTLFPSMYAP